MRWWAVLCVAVLWDTASPQPTKETSNGSDRECCPCPKDSDAASSNTLESVNPFTAASSAARATGCPCQLRSADSEGAPSAFLPAAVRAIRPFVSSGDSKEDPKPLLHPEVDLASSVLDTLREATDEEYKEAIAREAARAAQEPDGIAAESAQNMVTVVVSPKDTSDDDVMAEASHAHEARCINPLGRSSLNFRTPAYDSSNLLTSILRLPKRKPPTFRAWNLFDMDSGVGASNINEQIVEPTFKESVVETHKSQPRAKFSSNSKLHNIPNLRVPSLFKNTEGRENSAGSFLNKLRQSNKVSTKLEISKLISKLDTSHLFRKMDNNDLSLTTNVIDKDDGDFPSNFKLKIPHISTLIPKTDSSSILKNAEKDKFKTTNDNHVENSNPSKAIKLNIPHVSQLIPKIDLSKDNKVDTGLRGSGNNLKLQIPNLKASVHNNQIETDDALDSDSMDSASTIKERYSSFAKVNTDDNKDSESNSLEGSDDLEKPAVKSANIKNIEENEYNAPIKSNKINLKVPDLKFSPLKYRDTTTDLVNNVLKGIKVPDLRDLLSRDIFHLKKNDLATKSTEQKDATEVLQNNPHSTEILDTIPSPSEPDTNHVNFIEKEREDEVSTKINEKMQDMIENMPVKTEILDSLPKASEVNDVDHFDELEIDETGIKNDDLIDAASEQAPKSLVEGEEVSELVNEMQEMNEDSIDDIIDNTNNGVMDRENNAENIIEDVEVSRGYLDEVGKDDFAAEKKLDGLAISTDFQSLSEKSVPEISSDSDQNVQPTLREQIRQKLEDLKLPKITIDLPYLKDVTTPKDLVQTEIQNEDAATSKQDMSIEEAKENVEVNIDDLQQMSDSLLNQEKEKKNIALEEHDNLTNNNERSDLSEEVKISDNDVLESNNINLKKDKSECILSNTSNKNAEPDLTTDSKNNEMAEGASERVASIADPDFNLASPLRQSIILEPTSFGSDSYLFNGPGLDLTKLFSDPLPTLKIPNLLKPRGDSNINQFSAEDNNDSFNEEFEPSMSAQPSTSNFRSSLPSLQPLEDINLDILQLKPLSAGMPTLPRLNLNSFKTRLALPKSLDLKPVLLESSIGNKKGVIGATLTLNSGKKIDPSNLLQQASSVKSSNILRQSLALPSLDDLHESLWEKTQNLLSTPLEMTGRNAVEDTLRSSQVLTDNLRVHAENTVKEINQNLASTLKGAGLSSHGGLGSIRSSGNLLEEISQRHEDVNDKLKGISVDLSDRLESLRDSIFDQYRTPSLGSSILGQSILPSLSSAISKPSSTFRTYTKPQSNLKLSTKGKFVTPASKRKSSSRTSSTKSKLKTASSIVAPKTIEMPKFKAAPKESMVLKPLRKEPALKTPQLLTRDRPSLGILQPEKNLIDFDRPLIKKPRLGQSKVKISFSTTPPPPAFRNKAKFRADSKLKAKPFSLKNALPTLAKSASKDKGASRLGSFRDSSGFASEAIPSRVKAPLDIQTNLKASTEDLDIVTTTTLRPTFKLSLTKSPVGNPNLLKSRSLDPDPQLSQTELRNNDIPKIPALSWPKKIDDEFLTKVREALRARLAEIGKKTEKPVTKTKLERVEPITDVPDDMARSASNNNEVVDPQMMKENTSYTCKMMCTKNT